MSWLPDILAFERAVVTPYTFATVFIPVVLCFYAMAVLVQLPRTSLYRAALLPLVLWSTFRANMSLDFSWNYPGYVYLNQGLALGMFTVAMRCTAWVLAQKPYTRLPICKSGSDTIDGQNGNTPTDHDTTISSALWNAWDLIVNLRGIGWSGPPKIPIPTPCCRVESRLIFSLLSLCRLTILVLAFDILRRVTYTLGPNTFGTVKGGTIFDPSLPPVQRYMKSSFVTAHAGFTGWVIIETVYQLHATLYTILFQQYPSQWPPLFDSPWLSTSIASFWGRRWHQLFRECFVSLGSKPAERYFGRAGVVMGAFAVSGVLHDIGMRGMDRGADTLSVVGFFLMQGVGVTMEYAWKQATGRRVGGVLGWLWAFSWVILWGQLVVDVWGRTGLMGSEFWPEAYRPTTLLLDWKT